MTWLTSIYFRPFGIRYLLFRDLPDLRNWVILFVFMLDWFVFLSVGLVVMKYFTCFRSPLLLVFLPLHHLLLGLLPQELEKIDLLARSHLFWELNRFREGKGYRWQLTNLFFIGVEKRSPLLTVLDLFGDVVEKDGSCWRDEVIVLCNWSSPNFALNNLGAVRQWRWNQISHFFADLTAESVELFCFHVEQRGSSWCLVYSAGQLKGNPLNFVKLLHGNIMRVFSWEEVEAVELGGDGVPEAGGGECVKGVHLVLEAVLLVIYLF